MGSMNTFNDTVAARTRTADHIRSTPDLFALYESQGGLRSDLDSIFEAGTRAELLTHSRGAIDALGNAATVEVLRDFARLESDYVAIMAVVQAVALDLESAGADSETLASIEKILADETHVTFRPAKDGAKKRAVKSARQEAVRAEIQKDAAALLALTASHDALAKRKVTKARLEALRTVAEGLAGKLADRSAAKGAGKDATKAVREAVQDQKRVWSGCYRILALVGQADERVRNLLAEAAA